MTEIFILILPFFGIWAAVGAVAQFLGKAESLTDGMKKAGIFIINWWRPTPPPHQSIIEEWQTYELNQKIEKYFDFLLYEDGIEDENFIRLNYRCGQCSVDLSVIDSIFQKYLRTYGIFSYSGNTVTDTFISGGSLYFIFARSPDAIKQLHDFKRNRIMQQINTTDGDIIE